MQFNTFCHVEWYALDFERVQKFYGEVFGWTFTPMGEDYLLFHTPNSVDGGFSIADSVAPKQGAIVYIMVDSLEAYIEKIDALGGKTSPIHPIPEMGRITLFTDLEGNELGLFQAL